ncbi:MAG: hypothetical protein JXN60_08210 [Lentisphaerae bacterium]|nr:hypothetical protein [Lentisphaerota bacterium]
MKTRKTNIIAMCLVTIFCAAVYGASVGVDADEWNVPGEDRYGKVTVETTPEGATTISFPNRSAPPMPCMVTVVAEPGGIDGVFGGDYNAAGVKSVRFLAESDGHEPAFALVVLRSASGRSWRNTAVTVPSSVGVIATNQIAFQRSAGWETDSKGDPDSMWIADLANVDLIGITISQKGLQAQSYTISQFQLQDSDGPITPPAVLTPLEEALQERFGVTDIDQLTEEQKTVDLDEDGMTDLDELRSEHESGYADKIFVAEIVREDNGGEGILVKWACVKNGVYSLYRATSLTSGFALLDGASGLVAESTGCMTHRDVTATGAGPYFYRVRRE